MSGRLPGFASFKEQVKELMGIDLNDYSARQLKHRLTFIGRQEAVEDWQEYYRLLEESADKRKAFLKHLKINVSSFFRDTSKWDMLAGSILPDLVRQAAEQKEKSIFGPGPPEIRFWSVGCATGAEPYSLVMILEEAKSQMRFTFPPVLASDVVPDVLAKARTAVYSGKDVKDVPSGLKQKYLRPCGSGWQVRDRIRKQVKFIKHDMLRDRWSSGFHLIACRNVLIYMNDTVKQHLYRKFNKVLKPQGILFLGGSELLLQPEDYGFEKVAASFYRKT